MILYDALRHHLVTRHNANDDTAPSILHFIPVMMALILPNVIQVEKGSSVSL